jgi:phosphoadenosine phosphosulfate reductase
MDGDVVGAIRFDLSKLCFEFMPRIEGASRIVKKCFKGFVEVADDAAEYILDGMSVLMPGVVDFDSDVLEGEEVIVVCKGRVIAVGKTRFSGKVAKKSKKGMFVKVRKRLIEPSGGVPDRASGWDLVIKANKDIILEKEKEAVSFIKRTKEAHNLLVFVSFSGGKDSLATLLLVLKIAKPRVMFIDTGVEFPETLEYVKRISKSLGLELIRADAGERFWRGFEVFGMSGRDYRWCCKVCKLGASAKIVPGEFLNFIGQRRFESETRRKSGRIWRNSFLPKQVSASPIQNWNALLVWLFLMKEGVEVNPLYRLGLERIGCWVCPSSSMAEIELLKEMHPNLWNLFRKQLQAQGFTPKEVRHGFWRWQSLPKGQLELREHLKIIPGERVEIKKHPIVDHRRVENLANFLVSPLTEDIYLRSKLCLGCGVCLGQCRYEAIEFLDGKFWLNSNCRGCGKCHSKCPIVKYLYEKKI